MRVPNWLYNWGRLLGIPALVAVAVVGAFSNHTVRLVTVGAFILSLFIVLVEAVISCFTRRGLFHWWRK